MTVLSENSDKEVLINQLQINIIYKAKNSSKQGGFPH